MAFSSLHKPLFAEHDSIYFANSGIPPADHNNAFCEVSYHCLISVLPWLFYLSGDWWTWKYPFCNLLFLILFLGYSLYQGVQYCPDYLRVSEPYIYWWKSGPHAQFHYHLGWGKLTATTRRILKAHDKHLNVTKYLWLLTWPNYAV